MVKRMEVRRVLGILQKFRYKFGVRKANALEKTCHRLLHNINTIERNIEGGLDMSKSIERLVYEFNKLTQEVDKYMEGESL